MESNSSAKQKSVRGKDYYGIFKKETAKVSVGYIT